MRSIFKRILLMLAVALLAPSPMTQAETVQPLKAALLLEHGESSAWQELLKKGFETACSDSGLAGKVIIAPSGPDQTAIFRQAASSNDLVIVGSDGLHEILRDNAANFRRVKFGVVDAGIRAPNIMSVTFADEKAAFLAGAAAAMLAEEKGGRPPVIGWLSGEDVPALRSLYNGYVEGALLAVPGCRVIQAVAGSFANSQAAAGRVEWLLANGASVIALASGAGNQTAHERIMAAGATAIGLDAQVLAPALGTIVKAADRAVAEIVNAAAAGSFKGKEIIVYGLDNNGADFIGLERYFKNNKSSGRIERRIRELRHELREGSIHVPSLRQRTLCDCLD